MVTLRQLRYLEALAETLHFGQAAEACAVTQPALSMQIKELEEVAGQPAPEVGDRANRAGSSGAGVPPCLSARCARLRQASRACAVGSAQARGHSVNRALSLVGCTARAATALPESHFAPPRDDH